MNAPGSAHDTTAAAEATEGRPASPHDALPCAWACLDTRGLIRDVNQALLALVGLDRDAVCGRSFDVLLTGPSRVLYQSYVQPLLRMHGNVEEIALTLRDADGAAGVEVLFYSALEPARQEAPVLQLVRDGTRGTSAGGERTVQVLLAPILRRRGIEAEMLRVKRAADQAPGLIFQLLQRPDGSEHFPYVSEAVRQLYGVTADDARDSAEALFGQYDADDRARMLQGMAAAAAGGQDWAGTVTVRRGDQGVRHHDIHCSPRALANGVRVWHGYIADTTERRSLERALAEREATDHLNKMRSQFLARVSHELRTPLNGILGFAQLLLRDEAENLRSAQRDKLGVVLASGQHLLQLVNQLLDIASIDAGQSAFEVSPLPLACTLREAVDLVHAIAGERGVTVQAPAPGSADVHVLGNPLRLRQVFVNLLGNAIKYNRRGGSVTVQVLADEGSVRVRVQDTGCGMSATQLQSLFQPFNRLGAQDTGTEGTGLGLVITRHLLSLMGGSVEASSVPGVGSTFTVQLGRVRDALQPSAGSPPPPGPGVAALPAEQQARGRVLYVEDNPVNAVLMEAIVGLRPQCALRVARDGAQALAMLRQDDWLPDLMLLDMHLPDTTGQALLVALRQRAALAAVPAVMVSAAADGDDVQAARAAGFADYWVKPLDVDRTLAELDRWLAPHALSRP